MTGANYEACNKFGETFGQHPVIVYPVNGEDESAC